MKKKILFSIAILCFAFLVANNLNATEVASPDKLESASCFEHYKFQSVPIAVGVDKPEYTPGETAYFSGTVENKNDYPIVDGTVFVRVGEKRSDYLTQGLEVRDEFIPVSDLALNASSSIPLNFAWNIPTGLAPGDYRAMYYFSVGNRFNLGGLPFTNEIMIGFTDFKIVSENTGSVLFDKASTQVNSQKYAHIGNWPTFSNGSKVEISQGLKNTTKTDQTATITYDLFYWDSLNPENLISTRTESVTIKANAVTDLKYTVDSMDRSVYYLRITSVAGSEKSIVNIRFSNSEVSESRLNYVGLNQFPVSAGELTSVYVCYHNTGRQYTDNNRIVVSVEDKKGDTIFNQTYSGGITSSISAVKGIFNSAENLTYLKVNSAIYDQTDKLVEKYSVVYDCNNYDFAGCPLELPVQQNPWVWLSLVVGVVIVILSIILLALISRSESSRSNRVLVSLGLIIGIILIVIFVLLKFSGPVTAAETVSADGKTKSNTLTYDYVVGYVRNNQLIRAGTISKTLNVSISKVSDLKVNDVVTFTSSGACTYNGTGGNWDTPNCGETDTFTDLYYGGWAGQGASYYRNLEGTINLTESTPISSYTIESSNPNVISCNGLTCTVRGSGTAVLTAKMNQNVIISLTNNWVHTRENGWLRTYIIPNGIASSTIWDGYEFKYITHPTWDTATAAWSTVWATRVDTINLGKYEPSWTLTVNNIATPLCPAGTMMTDINATEMLDGLDNNNNNKIDEGGYSCQNNEYFEIGGSKYCLDYRISGSSDPINSAKSHCEERSGWSLANYTDGETNTDVQNIISKMRNIPDSKYVSPSGYDGWKGFFVDGTCSAVTSSIGENSVFSDYSCGGIDCGNSPMFHANYLSSCPYNIDDGDGLGAPGAICEYSGSIDGCLVDIEASCSPSPTTVTLSGTPSSASVTWTATGSGGVGPYSYSWIGAGGLGGKTTNPATATYNSASTYNATVTVGNGVSTTTVDCSVGVTVNGTGTETGTGTGTNPTPLTCRVKMVDPKPIVKVGANTNWVVEALGTPPLAIDGKAKKWYVQTGTGSPIQVIDSSPNDNFLTTSFSSTGNQKVSVEISDNGTWRTCSPNGTTAGEVDGVGTTTSSLQGGGTNEI